jgi:hypothetical protein
LGRTHRVTSYLSGVRNFEVRQRVLCNIAIPQI